MSARVCQQLQAGEPAPWFVIRSTSNERYHFDTAAGRYVVLSFLRSAADPSSSAVMDEFVSQRAVFDDEHTAFFGVSIDPADEHDNRLKQLLPGFRYFWDFGLDVSKLYRVCDDVGRYERCTFVLDRRLRVVAVLPFDRMRPVIM